MTKELIKLLNLIGGELEYTKPNERRITLSETKILKQGLDKQDIKSCLKYLSSNRIAQYKVGYAPEVTKSNIGIIYARHSSHRTPEYNQVDYILTINQEKIKPLLSQARKLISKSREGKPRLIEKNSHGNYLYNGHRIEMSSGTIYYDAFDILYLESDQDGFLSYADIEKQFVKRGHPEALNYQARNKRINNALINEQEGLFRFAKVNDKRLQNKTPDGRKLIKLIRSKGVQLSNTFM